MCKIVTSSDSPLRIDSVPVPGSAGRIGMTICPGIKDVALGGFWDRDLAADLDEITWWGASALVTLMEIRELHDLQVFHLPGMALKLGLEWHNLSLRAQDDHDDIFEELWAESSWRLRKHLAAGGRIVVHCRDGYGWPGAVATRLLMEFGLKQEKAVSLVQTARPAAVETPELEANLMRLIR